MKSIIFNQHQVNHALKNEEGMFRVVIKFSKNKTTQEFQEIALKKISEGFSEYNVCLNDFFKCHYKIGETIFVKEAFIRDVPLNEIGFPNLFNEKTWFKATDKKPEYLDNDWISPLHMKQEHSRLFPRIKSVKVERLQDISEEDCLREGIETFMNFGERAYIDYSKKHHALYNARESFATLWNSTHKKPEEKFEANPWVFVYEYEVVR